MRRLTQEDVLAVLEPMHPTINFSEFVYVGNKTKSRVSCKTCDRAWETSSNSLKKGMGCRKCASVKRASRWILTQEEVLAVLEPKHPTIDFSEFVYVSSATKSRVRCKTCGHAWETRPNCLKRGAGCRKCASAKFGGSVRHTQEEVLDALVPMHPTIDFSEFVYTGSSEKSRVGCKTCGHRWEVLPASLKNGSGCGKCATVARAESIRLTQEKVLAVLEPMHPTIDFSEFVYVDANAKVRVSCRACGHKWQPVYYSLQQGSGCKKCASSHGEKRVAEILDSRGIPYETEVTLKGTRLRFDFFIPSLNVAIEVQGEQHYFAVEHFGGVETFRKVIARDRIKRQWCKDNEVKLIAIPYLKKDVSKFEQYLGSVWARDEQCRITGMLIHTLESSTFEAHEQ